MFTLQKLNVVKVVDTEEKRDALLRKGFQLVKEPKGKKSAKTTAANKSEGDADAASGTGKETGEVETVAGDADAGK